MKIGAFGEVMLRLSPPEKLLLEQTTTLNMTFTGTGVNLLCNLSHFGIESHLLSALPDNQLGKAALSRLKSLGIETEKIILKYDHLGSYFAEMGYGIRPTQITYQNRRNSSFSVSRMSDYEIDEFLDTIDLIHICGISLSLTEETAKTAIELVKKAYEKKKIICFDFNFRPSLNQNGSKEKLKLLYKEILSYCSVVFGSWRDLVELFDESTKIESQEQKNIRMQQFLNEYDIDWFAGTQRETTDNKKHISGYLITKEKVIQTNDFELNVLDRIGAGDAFAAGILLGYIEKWPLSETVKFAIGNSLLAHTIHGDSPITTREQVYHILNHPNIDLIR